ncbi:MAG: TRAP transporter small permease subunit [Gammaproteobacteria bacterium]|jgi:TRAP-type mannitol/chloroaromatic compound transport system permease small subunit|nr:TRAP transporter small permease subunit [Gammaproteobacteria bacterium]HJO11112.1 TRAP transporter small permease subunit [Gammaproteobacteria bacterium]|tara:strand:+ start:11 stop:535 length:525 start_codon:yes stop_codon:yes gene_type:complete
MTKMNNNSVSNAIDKAMDAMGRAVSWLTVLLVVVTGLVVLLRYVFQTGSIALQEAIVYINALIFAIGAAYTLKEQGHVRVDIFYNRLGGKGRAIVDLSGVCVFLLPCTLFILWQSWDYVSISWQIRERSIELSGLPFVYLLKTAILVLGILLIVQGISELLKSLALLRQHWLDD